MYETATPLAPTTTGARLGERVRTLRVSAGLTQTQLAGTRFSKEYISQIERGKTRPTESTVAWLADRLGVDPVLLSSGISTDDSAKLEASLDSRRGVVGRAAVRRRRRGVSRDPAERGGHGDSIARAAPAHRRSLGSARGRPGEGSDRAAAASTGDRRSAAASRISISPTSSTGSRSVATSSRACRPRSRCSTRHFRSPSVRVCRATCSARTSCSGARAVTAGCATTSPHTTTSSARSSWRRSWATAQRSPTRTSKPRSSRSGRATTFSRAATRSGRRSSTSS